MLHEVAEVRELRKKMLDLPPRGSLLVWIDNFLSSPETPLDRTLGRWENVLQATHVIPNGVRSRITLKAFGVGKASNVHFPEGNPQRHGDFTKWNSGNQKFWKPKNACKPKTTLSLKEFCADVNLPSARVQLDCDREAYQ